MRDPPAFRRSAMSEADRCQLREGPNGALAVCPHGRSTVYIGDKESRDICTLVCGLGAIKFSIVVQGMCVCMRMYVCMYVCVCVCMYVWVCVCMYVCMYVCVCVCVYVCMYVCM